MAEQLFRGSCQCGAVVYDVKIDLEDAIACNCSRCQRLGAILAFAPHDKFQLNAGRDSLTEFRFNTGRVSHLFCRTCGVESFAEGQNPDGSAVVAINVNCLEGVNPRALKVAQVDGRSYSGIGASTGQGGGG